MMLLHERYGLAIVVELPRLYLLVVEAVAWLCLWELRWFVIVGLMHFVVVLFMELLDLFWNWWIFRGFVLGAGESLIDFSWNSL